MRETDTEHDTAQLMERKGGKIYIYTCKDGRARDI